MGTECIHVETILGTVAGGLAKHGDLATASRCARTPELPDGAGVAARAHPRSLARAPADGQSAFWLFAHVAGGWTPIGVWRRDRYFLEVDR